MFRSLQLIEFMKNLSMMAATLLIAANGAGAFSSSQACATCDQSRRSRTKFTSRANTATIEATLMPRFRDA